MQPLFVAALPPLPRVERPGYGFGTAVSTPPACSWLAAAVGDRRRRRPRIRLDISFSASGIRRLRGLSCRRSVGRILPHFVSASLQPARDNERDILIAVIGDVHEEWSETDHEVLRAIHPDLTLFVGDFAEEDVPLMRKVASFDLPKAVALGNHDGQYTLCDWGRAKYIEKYGGSDGLHDDRFGEILEVLGDSHVGFSVLDFPELDISVVGGRPCSWGGEYPEHCAPFYEKYFGGAASAEESSAKILEAAKRAGCNNIIFLSHNGPMGLGESPADPVGRDWGHTPGGDRGDADLADAIQRTREEVNGTVLMCAFGHMHRVLQNKQGLRRMVHRDDHGIVHVNAAHVPRTRPHVVAPGGTLHSVTLVTVSGMPCAPAVSRVRHVWIDSVEKQIREDELLFELDEGIPGHHGPVAVQCELPA